MPGTSWGTTSLQVALVSNSAHRAAFLLESLFCGNELGNIGFCRCYQRRAFLQHPSAITQVFAILETVLLYSWQGSTLWAVAQPRACSPEWDKQDRNLCIWNNVSRYVQDFDLLPIVLHKISFPRGNLLCPVTEEKKHSRTGIVGFVL